METDGRSPEPAHFIELRIVDSAGAPIADAGVQLLNEEEVWQSTMTGPDGCCRLAVREARPLMLMGLIRKVGFVPLRVSWELPPGMVELLALSEGFISSSETDEASIRGRVPTWRPQAFAPGEEVDVKMEATAQCEIRAVTEKGEPLPGVHVAFCPNVVWASHSSGLIGYASIPAVERLTMAQDALMEKVRERRGRPFYSGITDEKGVVTIGNLPATGQGFVVQHDEYELIGCAEAMGAVTFAQPVDLRPGEMMRVTVRFKRKNLEPDRAEWSRIVACAGIALIFGYLFTAIVGGSMAFVPTR